MNEHYCGARSRGCYVRVREDEVACGMHYQMLPVSLKISLDNAMAYRRRTNRTHMHIRAMADCIAWLAVNAPEIETSDDPVAWAAP